MTIPALYEWNRMENLTVGFVDKLHKAAPQCVIAVSGGGTEGLAELLRHGDGSRTLLEAVVPYNQLALDRFIGSHPDKYCSDVTARQMAMAAYLRARELAPDDEVFGVGMTCSLRKKGQEREGREHLVYVAVQTPKMTRVEGYSLLDNHTREGEEIYAGVLLLNAVAEGCGIEHRISYNINIDTGFSKCVPAMNGWADLIHGDLDMVEIDLTGDLPSDPPIPRKPAIIFPGSFNPLHDGHRAMMEAAYKHIDPRRIYCEIGMEICVRNIAKAALDFVSIRERVDALREEAKKLPYLTKLYLTSTPLFKDKAALFSGVTFLMGQDTLTRLCQCDFYRKAGHFTSSADAVVKTAAILKANNNNLLVFPRPGNEPNDEVTGNMSFLNGVCEFIPDTLFQQNDISSSEIRNKG